ncbi:Hypothetical protein A7982_07208 [Minicystis rosea]|nr:Hypothetical protein A7982_07208 [Minicystis rosea]
MAAQRILFAAFATLSLAACSRGEEQPRRAPPPPPPKAAPAGACAAGGGKIADATTAPIFPASSGGFCLDPNGGEKTFGEAASLPLDNICTDLFDGECEIYKGYGVRRVVEARYVDGSGTPATVDVHLSKFATTEGAYAMFTRRVVGDGDPASDATPRAIEGGGAAALGVGNAYVWRGLYLAEITYNNETAAEAAIRAASEKLLPPFVKEMGSKIPGDTALPPAAAALPKDGLIPLGVRFVTKDLLGDSGVGAGAFGYYRAGDKRYRVASIMRADVDQAKDVLGTLAKLPGATKEKGVGDGAVRLMRKDGESAPVEWVFARSGKAVLGVGDEVRALRAGMTADEHAKVSLTKDEKMDRLKKLITP